MTDDGIVISVNDEHWLNKERLIDDGIVISVNNEHPLNDDCPIVVTDDGIVIVFKVVIP